MRAHRRLSVTLTLGAIAALITSPSLAQSPGGEPPEPEAPTPGHGLPAPAASGDDTAPPAGRPAPLASGGLLPQATSYEEGPRPTAPRLPYREGSPVPKGYTVESVPRGGMIIGGGVMAGSLHLISMIAAIALDAESNQVIHDAQGGTRTDPEFDNRYTPLFAPLVGPFITVKTADASGTGAALLIMNGVAQVTGLSLVIAGIVAQKQVLTRDAPSWALTPLVTEGGGGMALGRTF